MATGTSITTYSNREFLFRLETLVIDGGIHVLRKLFDQRLQNQPLNVVLAIEKSRVDQLLQQETITEAQYNLLYPPNGQPPNSMDFDIPLVVCLLKNLECLGLNQKYKWNVSPKQTDTSTEANLSRLKAFPDQIIQTSMTVGFQQESFEKKWHEIKDVLLKLNSSLQNPVANFDEVIENFKYSPVDPVAEQRVQLACEQWQSMEHGRGKRLSKAEGRKKVVSMRQRFFGRLYHSINVGKKRLYKDLEDDLISFYKRQHNRISISPFMKEDLPLLQFYVMPDIQSVKVIRSRDGDIIKKSPVTQLRDLFYMQNKLCTSIYLTADSGFGKTVFSKRLALSWCHAKRLDESESRYFSKDEITGINEFSFLFLVLLCDSTSECDMDVLIFDQIFSQLPHDYSLDDLREILSEERCLVILDGLDEWTPPLNSYGYGGKIPQQKVRENVAVLTTTRPWKLSVLGLHTSQIDQKFELRGLNATSAEQLERSVISHLYEEQNENKIDEYKEEFNMTVQKKHTLDLTAIPLFLLYTLCLWFYKFRVGKSIADLYSSFIEYMLSRTVKKDIGHTQKVDTFQGNIPLCFDHNTQCKRFYSQLTTLGKLAFHTLFSGTKESMLVFDGCIAEQYLSKDELIFCLKTGIITQIKVRGVTLLQQKTEVSFAHKTVQEFLAALYINSVPDQSSLQEIMLSRCKCVKDILDMSDMLMFIVSINSKSLFSREVMKIINEDELTHEYRSSLQDDFFSRPLEDLQDMYISCCNEIPPENEANLCLQDVFIDYRCRQEEYRENLKKLTTRNIQNIRSLYIIMPHLMDTPYNTARKVVDYFALSNLENIEKIHYRGVYSDDSILPMLNSSVKSLSLSCDWLRGTWSHLLFDKVTSLQKLEAISIMHFKMSHSELSLLLDFISQRDCLSEIELVGLSCSDHRDSCPVLSVDLSRHLALRKITLKWLNLSQVIINMTTLEKCWLDLSNRALLLRFLNSADDKLNTFYCERLQSTAAIDEVLRMLRESPHIRLVTFVNMNLGRRSPKFSPDLNIERLTLWDVTLESSAIRELVDSILKLHLTVQVEILDCIISPREEFETLKIKIRTSQHVRILNDEGDWFHFETIKDGC